MKGRRGRRSYALATALALFAQSLHAAEPAALEEAKEQFRRGLALLGTGDTEKALEYFMRSRELVPSSKNTVNAAICLERLGRYDEALEMYEEVLTRFAAELDAEDRENLGPVMAALRERIGYLNLTANVDGLVIVDGRERGRLPLRAPLRLLPGARDVRIVKDGYRSFQHPIEITAGKTVATDAELEPLAGSGAVRVEGRSGVELDVLVDGRRVGKTPWEGSIRAGKHVVQAVAGDVGSMPEVVDVLEGKTQLLRVIVKPLSGPIRIASQPTSAELYLADVPLGRGSWSGRLPAGSHRVRAGEPGYFSQTQSVELSAAKPAELVLSLARDPRHSRWPQPSHWTFAAGLRAGPVYAPHLSAGSDSSCPSLCAGDRATWGVAAGLDATLSHDSGFGAELVAGYARFRRNFGRAVLDDWEEVGTSYTTTYAFEQTLDGRGPFATLLGRLRRPTGFGVDLVSALGVGALLATYTTGVEGLAWTNENAVDLRPTGAQEVDAVSPFFAASLGVERKFGRLSAHVAMGGWFFPYSGPRFPGPTLGAALDCSDESAPGAIGCAPQANNLEGERVHGPFWALTPELGAEYTF